MDAESIPRTEWKYRRRIVFATLGFCAAVVAFILWRGSDTELMRTALTDAFLLAGAVIAYYVGGAVWDDQSMRNALVALAKAGGR